VLLGSARTSPWVHLFDAMLKFHGSMTPYAIPWCASVRSRASSSLSLGGIGWVGPMAYCALAFVPNCAHARADHRGTVGDSTEATGEYITNIAASSELWASLLNGIKAACRISKSC